jgi:hypothetical protein
MIFLPCASSFFHSSTAFAILLISACRAGVSFDSIFSSIRTFHFVTHHSMSLPRSPPHKNHTMCPTTGKAVPSVVAPTTAPPAPLYRAKIPLSFIVL